jgi:glyoxylase-like metal-dependent hydrolase (beta-lactamase superfamily II)
MSINFFVGSLDVACFDDGILKSSVDCLVGMDRDQAMSVSGADSDGALFMPVNNFVFRRGDAVILIDAGAADSMQPTLGKLPENLRAGGVDPSSVTHVLLTHLHPDHANGLIDARHDAVFANAEIVVHETEYAFWMKDETASDSDHLKRIKARNRLNLQPYRDRITLIRDGANLLGCGPILAPGHSPGHTCWRIETGDKDLMAWGDLVHFSSVQLEHPQTAVTYDLDPDLARATRLRMLDMIAVEGLAIAGAHVAKPGFGRIERHGDGFRIESI